MWRFDRNQSRSVFRQRAAWFVPEITHLPTNQIKKSVFNDFLGFFFRRNLLALRTVLLLLCSTVS